VNLIVILMTYVRYLYSINCLTVICLPSMLLFILWRDTTSELWSPVRFPLHCYIVLLLLALFTFLHNIILLPLDTLNPLFIANRWDWQPHRKLGAKFLVVCRFHVAARWRHTNNIPGAIVQSVTKLAGITFWSLAFSYWFDKPWFHNWGKTCYCAHHTFLLGFPTGCYLHAIRARTMPWHGRGARAMVWCGRPLLPLHLIFGLCLVSGKIGIQVFVSSNSENISCVAFLKHKNSRQGTGTVASR
jgi:hypothetical protein